MVKRSNEYFIIYFKHHYFEIFRGLRSIFGGVVWYVLLSVCSIIMCSRVVQANIPKLKLTIFFKYVHAFQRHFMHVPILHFPTIEKRKFKPAPMAAEALLKPGRLRLCALLLSTGRLLSFGGRGCAPIEDSAPRNGADGREPRHPRAVLAAHAQPRPWRPETRWSLRCATLTHQYRKRSISSFLMLHDCRFWIVSSYFLYYL